MALSDLEDDEFDEEVLEVFDKRRLASRCIVGCFAAGNRTTGPSTSWGYKNCNGLLPPCIHRTQAQRGRQKKVSFQWTIFSSCKKGKTAQRQLRSVSGQKLSFLLPIRVSLDQIFNPQRLHSWYSRYIDILNPFWHMSPSAKHLRVWIIKYICGSGGQYRLELSIYFQ